MGNTDAVVGRGVVDPSSYAEGRFNSYSASEAALSLIGEDLSFTGEDSLIGEGTVDPEVSCADVPIGAGFLTVAAAGFVAVAVDFGATPLVVVEVGLVAPLRDARGAVRGVAVSAFVVVTGRLGAAELDADVRESRAGRRSVVAVTFAVGREVADDPKIEVLFAAEDDVGFLFSSPDGAEGPS